MTEIDYTQTPEPATVFVDVGAIQCVSCGALAMAGDELTICACGPRDENGDRHLIAMQCDCGALSLLSDDRENPDE